MESKEVDKIQPMSLVCRLWCLWRGKIEGDSDYGVVVNAKHKLDMIIKNNTFL